MLLDLPGFGLFYSHLFFEKGILSKSIVFLIKMHNFFSFCVVFARLSQNLFRKEGFISSLIMSFLDRINLLNPSRLLSGKHVVGITADLAGYEPICQIFLIAFLVFALHDYVELGAFSLTA